MSLEDLEKELYGAEAPEKESRAEAPAPADPAGSWISEKKNKSGIFKISGLRRLVGFAGWLAAACAVVFFAFWLASADRVSGGFDISIVAPDEIRRGLPLELTVEVFNRMNDQLEEGNLELRLPNGLVFLENSERASQARVLGSVPGHTLIKQTFKILPVAEENSIREIVADFSYKRGKNLFSSEAEHEIKIQNSFLRLEAELPERILRGGSLPVGLKIKNDADSIAPDFLLRAEYPSSFSPQETETEGESGVWRFSGLAPGEEKEISVKGVFQSSDDKPLAIPFRAVIPLGLKEFVIAENVVVAEAASSPVVLELSANEGGQTAKFGDTLSYSVRYRNESGVALSGVVVRLGLIGSWFDWSSVKTDGAFDSVRNEAVWDSNKIPEFRLLEPNASGELKLSIRLLAAPTRVSGSYSVRAAARLDSPTVPHYLEADSTSVSAGLETKLNGPVYLDARALYRDSDSGFINSGPFPPQAGQKTEYTIHWILRNFSNELKNISISASLPAGVEWLGKIKSSDSPEPVFDPDTNKITWSLARVAPGRGASSAPIEAIFQIAASPAASAVGNFQSLLSETVLEGLDSFTGSEVLIRDVGLSTRLPDDPTVGENQGRVVP